MARPPGPLSVCETCGTAFLPKRRGQQRERRCPQCIREWRWSQHRLHRLSKAAPGGLWPDLVAAELLKQE